MNALLIAFTAACRAFAAWVEWQKLTHLDRLEDEIAQLEEKQLRLADAGSALDKLLLEQVELILSRKRERLRSLRSSNGDASP